jgi:hypothetical protein
MKKPILILFMVIGAIFTTSCKSRRATVTKLETPGTFHAQYDATKRGSIVFSDGSGNIKILSEVPPDAVVTSVTELTNKLTGKLNGQELSAEQVTKISESMSELGKRTVAVDILRDALYRLEEMTFSGGTIDTNELTLFTKILDVAEKIAQAEIDGEQAKTAKAAAKEAEEKADQEKSKVKLEKLELTEGASRSESESNRSSVVDWERKGFRCIANKDIDGAMLSFDEAYNIYPTYHSVAEIRELLKNQKNKLADPKAKEWKTVIDKIVRSYGWKVNTATLEELRNAVN